MTAGISASGNALWILVAVATTLGVACSGPTGDELSFPTVPPPPLVAVAGGQAESRETVEFHAVADVLVAHCGTLDCHGSLARNFRIYDVDGVRLRPNVTGTAATTDEEYLLTYQSLVTLQPEILSAIYRDHGLGPERWMVITKGRGTEHHKGGSRMRAGDDADRCVVSWISGRTDLDACGRGSIVEPPGGPGF